MLAVLYFDPACRAAVTENCKLDLLVNLTVATIFGFASFFLISLISGLVRRARDALD